tara:strand:+ start:373 stop:780 length:408 start_codon:yes stop_codon:yes gene_type:complete
MDSYDEYYTSESETDSEWEETCERAVQDQEYDMEARELMEKMRAHNVGYSPLKGYADGFAQRKWLNPSARLKDVVRSGKLQSDRVNKEPISAARIEDFLEIATLFVRHHRRRVPGTQSRGYITAVAAEMIRWQLL